MKLAVVALGTKQRPLPSAHKRRGRAAPLFATAKTLTRVLFVGQGVTTIGPSHESAA
jgi:hypothetical protein